MSNNEMPGLMPLGGGSSSESGDLTPVGGGAPPAPAAPPVRPPAPLTSPPPPTAQRAVPSRFDTPPAAPMSRFSTPAPPPTSAPPASPAQTPSRPASNIDNRPRPDDPLSAGQIAATFAAGLVAGGIYLAGWLWIVNMMGRNWSLIAVGVGFVVGFIMAAVAQRDSPIVTFGAAALSVGFAIAGVWQNMAGGGIFGMLFSVLCCLLAGGAAMKAADNDPENSDYSKIGR